MRTFEVGDEVETTNNRPFTCHDLKRRGVVTHVENGLYTVDFSGVEEVVQYWYIRRLE